MPTKTLHIASHLLLTALLLVVIAASGVLIWVATGPREANILTPYLEEALTPENKSFKIDIERTMLHWDGWKRPVGLHAVDVRVVLPQGHTQARLPEVVLDIDLPSLLFGELRLESITVDRAAIRLYMTESGDIGFGIGETGDGAQPRIISFNKNSLRETPAADALLGLQRIEITNAKLALHSEARGKVLMSPRSNIRIIYRQEGMWAEASMDLLQETQSAENAQVNLRGVMDFSTGNIGINTAFQNLSPALISQFLPPTPWTERLQAPFSGRVKTVLSAAGEVLGGTFDLSASAGTLQYPEAYAEPVLLSNLAAKGHYKKEFSQVVLEEGRLTLDGQQQLNISGEWRDTAEGPHLTLHGSTQELTMERLVRYWPLFKAPITREWVTTNITKGIADAELSLTLTPGMLEQAALPSEAVSAQLTIRDAEMRYLPDHPPLRDLVATVRFTGDNMELDATQAKFMDGTSASRAHVEIPDFNADAMMLHADFDFVSPAADIATFLSRPEFTFAGALALKPEEISGTLSGNAKLGVLLYETLADGTEREGDLKDYTIEAGFEALSQPKLLGKYDVSGGKGTLKLDNKGLSLNGGAKIQGAPSTISLGNDFVSSVTDVKVEFPAITAMQLQSLGYPMPGQLEGNIALNVSLRDDKKTTLTRADADVSSLALMVPEVGLAKPAGARGKLAVTIREDLQSGKLAIPEFTLITDGASIRGSAALTSERKPERIEITEFRAGNNDLSAIYSLQGKIMTLSARGASIDLSALVSEDQEHTSFSQSAFDNQDIKLQFDRVILGPERVASMLKAEWRCDHIRCYHAQASGVTGKESPFRFAIFAEGRQRKVNLSAEDAGDFLRLLGIIDTVRKGNLAIEAAFDDQQPGNPLSGRITIRDFTLQKAPVLTKILTLASLTGILDALTGNGISFSKLSVPFTLANDLATVEDAKVYGSSIGITASGTLDLVKADVHMKGVVVPAYSVNSVLGNIPIIGELAGGDEGLFAANYSVKGQYPDNAEVSVNPLSILTPGFLRGLFDAGDAPKKPPAAEKQ